MSESSDSDAPEATDGTDSPQATDSADTTDSSTADRPDSAPGTVQTQASADASVVVCFDMDGVLVDSEDYWHAAEREEILPRVLTDGSPTPDLDEVTGMYYGEIYDYLAEHYEVAVDKDEFMALYEETAESIYGERVNLLDGAAEFVDELRDAGVPVALVSSSPRDWIEVVLDRFDLAFDLVAPAEEFDGPGKPEPGLYEEAIRDLGGTVTSAVAVEDSENGVRAAARSGAYTIAVRDDHNVDSDLSAADEVVVLDRADPEALFRAVRHSTRTIRESVSGSSGNSG
ncbi:HAD family hydrolase [Halobaculum gomorrense]|uniref:Haloacid dehalogenase superfamily, subfamily IA, variant 3 with third motif having DD or ED n=1 Tax=Halobaculum gomorrense TaxID=43928 RepID=A0A1M5ST86_9EURY|nr:HAD family phosphatase [Halobaculum gomorrense]SHH41712.1 haloacid dehalogenase superfamily, subfamily IA, variant 3 with third motif having DD or ED [Halobaculum gomorrense]